MNDDVQEPALPWKDRICETQPWTRSLLLPTISPLYDWYNTFFHVDFKFEVLANNGNADADPESAPINGAFSLIKNVTVKSVGKPVYEDVGRFWWLCKKYGARDVPVLVPWQRRNNSDKRRRNKLRNPTTRAAFTCRSTGWSPHSSRLLFMQLLRLCSKMTLKWSSRMTAKGEGLLSKILNCGFHNCRWHLKDTRNNGRRSKELAPPGFFKKIGCNTSNQTRTNWSWSSVWLELELIEWKKQPVRKKISRWARHRLKTSWLAKA